MELVIPKGKMEGLNPCPKKAGIAYDKE
jgi:hypothetical protein